MEYVIDIVGEHGIPFKGIYIDLYITEGKHEGVNTQHEVWQLESTANMKYFHKQQINCSDIFVPLQDQCSNIRGVLTVGIAGIGKTFLSQKFILDWAEGLKNQDVTLVIPLMFRELNLIKDHRYSLLGLIKLFYPALERVTAVKLTSFKVVFIFDGLDESRFPLDFQRNELVSDVTQIASVDVLLTNIIMSKMLPAAFFWITSRPAAAHLIPPKYIDRVTEVRGFTDPQKEEYFRVRFRDEKQASQIISHVKTSRSLHIMCHIPVFCRITAAVVKHMLRTDEIRDLPSTLTEMYAHFLIVQIKRNKQKFGREQEMDQQKLMEKDIDFLLKLGKLAFDNLEKGNLMFYEEDLKYCGLDVRELSVYSGVFTQIFRRDCVLFEKTLYCFIHLTIQEFIAAVYMFHCFTTKKQGALKPILGDMFPEVSHLEYFLWVAIHKALESKNGHLDLFVRFLHGLSLESNQNLLAGLLAPSKDSLERVQKVLQNLKELQVKNAAPERSINIFLCLVEMKDHSVHREISEYLGSENQSEIELSSVHCSALAYMLQVSEEVLDVFDLKKYVTSSREGRVRLIPAVRNTRRAILSGCGFATEDMCEILSSVLGSDPTHLRELDLSNNHLMDSGVLLLSAGLKSPHCRLNTLRLSSCRITETSCDSMAEILCSTSSHLRELDLSDNNLMDAGITLLTAGLRSPHCRLEILRLSGCLVTEKGCVSLASALSANPSHLRELDLNYNQPGDIGGKLLSAGLEGPDWSLEILQ
ncbi:protein NLRC3-like isoform X2 [Lampris incognitus]|uniref:protein NLRC3-like isoform X2 n=1 Tax=Lampris incognitus TaxID=2546036 RepID=UPI0024B58FF1|nr:protein NLRC3-like isoform X2 [Lampris incognitus]